jgi:hypothetical protein
MTGLKIISAIAAVIASPAIVFLGNTLNFRSLRLRALLGNPLIEFNPIGAPFLPKASFVSDLEKTIMTSGGVKIVWAPQGAGKTTTVRKVLIKMKELKKIRGCIVITPPDSNAMPSIWFRNALHDSFGELLRTSEKLSQILPKSDGRPFVFVFDQVDSVPYGEDMKRFIMSVAEDSYLTRRYVVLILTADAVNAKTMWEWNGHEKIVLMSDIRRQSPMNYRWDQEDIEKWIVKYAELNDQSGLEEGASFRNYLKAAAITAGTPGFLIENVISHVSDVSEFVDDAMNERAMYKNEQWKFGGNKLK